MNEDYMTYRTVIVGDRRRTFGDHEMCHHRQNFFINDVIFFHKIVCGFT